MNAIGDKIEGETGEAKVSKGLPCGNRPSQKEVDDHERIHLPFRSWCEHCVRGKAQSHPHWQKDKEDTGIPTISWDYMYIKDDEVAPSEGDTPIVVWKDSNSKGAMAFAVPNKGDCEYAVRRGSQDVNKILGYNRMCFKGDQEPALRTMMGNTKILCGDQCTLDDTPVGDSQSNGDVESAIKGIQGQFRTMRGDLETCYGRKIGADHVCMPWLVRHASGTIFREQVGSDGMTAYKRIKGRDFKKELVKFGECVWYLRPKSKGKAKGISRWENGCWMGIREESGEYIIGTAEGFCKVRSVRRKGSHEERWNWEEFNAVRGLPWEPVPGRPGIEMTARIGSARKEREIAPRNVGEDGKVIKRAFWITREDVRKHGITEGCRGCERAITGGMAANHTERCRSRFEEVFTRDGDPRLLRQAERFGYGKEDETTEQAASSSAGSRDVEVLKQEDEEMDSDSGEPDDDMDGGDAMLFSLSPDERVQKALNGIKRRVEDCRRNQNWQDGVKEMHRALKAEGIGDPIMEVFSPPRVNGMAERLGVMPGLSLDLSGMDPDDGQPWDFNDNKKRAKAMDMVLGKRALLVIGSPMCKAFSRLQNWNYKRMDPEKKERMIREGKRHVEFCMMLYKIQHDNGMYFLHEHPYSATSWKLPIVQDLMKLDGVQVVKGDMCAFGMWQERDGERQLVMKPTGFMTNAQELAKELSETCSGDHSHIKLLNGRAKRAEVYPDELCYRIVRGLVGQMKRDGRIQAGGIGAVMAEEESTAWDDTTGEELDAEKVREARGDEIEEVHKHQVYRKVPIKECWDVTGKAPIQTRWLDINKGDKVHPDYRSRLVAKDFKKDRRMDLFAATPPLEALKMLLSLWMKETIGWKEGKEPYVMDFIDIRRA